jgi:RNA 2',3'-cyclic 3'-phosphodiesterase
MRTFVALNLSPETRAALYAATEPLRTALDRGVSWTREPALHLTLKFLGERPEEFVSRLGSELRGTTRGVPACALDIGGVGAFPSLRRPRVLWVGIATNSGLTELYQRVETACAALGAERETRAFHPHVTLGRVREGARVDSVALARSATEVNVRRHEWVATADIMESVLGREGATYRVVDAVPLGHDNSEA